MENIVTQKPISNEGEIARLAYSLWEKDGRQSGRDMEYWLAAELQLRAASAEPSVQAKAAHAAPEKAAPQPAASAPSRQQTKPSRRFLSTGPAQ
ncbi:MAG: DUF2934 domain-containing protein [Candidatus Omnitrophica bacterium]|nr:DUF2934 domain-containing protein [Candidatus Omnitrophota bacterium]